MNAINDYFDINGVNYLGLPCDNIIRAIFDKLTLARKAQVPVYFINDTMDKERSRTKKGHFAGLTREELMPQVGEILLQKTHLSAFINTPLEEMLLKNNIRHLVILGASTNTSIFFTAVDAKSRGFNISIFENCVLANDRVSHAFMLQQMENVHGIEIY